MRSTSKWMVLAGLILVHLGAIAQVHRSPSGYGGALILPYWTAAGGNDSLLSVRNENDHATVAKVHWLDDQGELLQSFNLYLDARSVWTGAVAEFDIGPGLITVADACVLPSNLFSEEAFSLQVMPLASPRGSLEIIEMASPDQTSGLSSSGRWIACEALAERFESGGAWQDDPNAGLVAPAQKLSASVSIINILKGTMNSVAATALARFSDLAQHSAPESSAPDLGHAIDSDAPMGGTRSLACPVAGCRIDEWAAPIEAVAAALMTTSLRVDYAVLPEYAGEFEWMVHRPLKRYEDVANGFEVGSEPTLSARSRDGFVRGNMDVCIPIPPAPMYPPCGHTEYPLESGVLHHSLPFDAPTTEVGNLIESSILAHPTEVWPAFAFGGQQSNFDFLEGTAELSLGNHTQPLIASDGAMFLGEPVVSFAIQQFTNGMLVDSQGQNVLANYRGTELPRSDLTVALPD